MPRTLLLVGTRKGCFLLESDGDRRDWALRGPFCEGWPVYHAVHDPSTGAIYAAAASEWHGSAVWKSPDLGETWTLSSEGLAYDGDGGRKLSKVSTLAVNNGRVLVGVEAPGIFDCPFCTVRSLRPATSGTIRRINRRATSASPP